jgi:hypothetical protein
MRNTALLTLFFVAAGLQAADPALVNLVMPDATVMAGINVQKAKTTPFGQFLLTQMPTGSGLTEFTTTTGFDPRQDLTEVLMASNTQPNDGLVLARGTFNPTQIAAAVTKDGKHTSQTYNGVQLITATGTGDNGAVAFLNASIALAGNLASVKAAIDRSHSNNAIDPGLAAKVASFAAADAWSVSIAPLPLGAKENPNNPLGNVLKNVQAASGSVTFSSPVELSAEAVAQSPQDATSLSDVIKFVASLMLTNKDAAPLTAVLQSLNVTTNNSTVKLSISIPEDVLEQVLKNVQASPHGNKEAKKAAVAHV